MTQPPDERDPRTGDPTQPPSETPGEDVPPSESPTQAWTPATPPVAPTAGPEPTRASDDPPPPPPPPDEPPAPASPILSASPATPTVPTSGWVQPGTPAASPTVGWELPAAPAPAPATEGYVIAGVGARIVAYLIDAVLVAIIPTLLQLFLTDYADIIRSSIEAGINGISTQITIPVTPNFVLVSVITIALHYIYFVGFWTSRGRATPGMRGLKMQVVDVTTGQTLSVVSSTKRWILLGAPLGLLSLIEPLQSIAGLISLLLIVVVFLTVVTDDRKQGLHDRWARSLVIRNATSGDGATLVGCVVLALMVVGIGIVISLASLIVFAPLLLDILSQVGQSI